MNRTPSFVSHEMHQRETSRNLDLPIFLACMLCACSLSGGRLWAEDEFPSLIVPSHVQKESSTSHQGSLTTDTSEITEEKAIRGRVSTKPRLVNPEQLIYERAVREARAREARLESRRWHGVSSSRPSLGWGTPYYHAVVGDHWKNLPYGPVTPWGYHPYGYAWYSPSITPVHSGVYGWGL